MDQLDIQLFQPLKQLQVANNEHYVKVRVLTVWKRPLFSNPSQTYSIEFVCADEQGNKISGTCLSKWLNRFQRFFINQNVLLIKRPLLGSNIGPWRIVEHPLKLSFNVDTHVGISTEWSGDDHFFNFTDFRQIKDLESSKTSSIDLIGVLLENSPLFHFKTNAGQDSVRLTAKLQDLNGEVIQITLFDEFAHQLINYLATHADEPHYVIIVQFSRFAVYKDRDSVSNAFNGTNVFINSADVKEISDYLERYLATVDSPSTPSYSRASSGIPYSLEEDFLKLSVFNHTAEVEGIQEANKVVILGTIIMVYPTWYYLACNHCLRIVEVIEEPLPITEGQQLAITDETQVQSGAFADVHLHVHPVATTDVKASLPKGSVTYKCKNEDCNSKKKVLEPFPRFKIMLKVQDSSETVELTLFDGQAVRILHKSAIEVKENFESEKKAMLSESKNMDENDDVAMKIPTDLQALLERKYAFKIDVSDFNIKKRYKFYTVVKMTDDQAIIKALDDKYNIEQHYVSDSVKSSSKEPQSNNFGSEKDVMSVTDDNETPLSVNTVGTNYVRGIRGRPPINRMQIGNGEPENNANPGPYAEPQFQAAIAQAIRDALPTIIAEIRQNEGGGNGNGGGQPELENGKPQRMRSYITYAMSLLQEKGSSEIVFKAMGRAINKTVTIVELIKRRIVGLHQITSIGSTDITDTWEPLEEGLLPLETTRHVSMITITLSMNELNTSSIGYQPPLPADQVKASPEFEYEGDGSPTARGRGRGGRGRGRGRFRPAQGNGYAQEEYDDGGWDGPGGYPPRGRGRGRGRGFRGRGRGNYNNAPFMDAQQDAGGYNEDRSRKESSPTHVQAKEKTEV
ncbi:hypothetical protein SSX86_032062 [Deinandra increscens subsp. villosa]|uniref:Uncharacterized protein n=1 Tax=Deinandra increscens subsp. villosa TaxID=3103831 RepID=A0AAP0C3L9_9ASTR